MEQSIELFGDHVRSMRHPMFCGSGLEGKRQCYNYEQLSWCPRLCVEKESEPEGSLDLLVFPT